MKKQYVWLGLILMAAAFSFWYFNTAEPGAGRPMVDVTVPTLTARQQEGEALFNENCAVCHGRNAAGNDGMGPPLVHKIYEPSHHPDVAFELAASGGVRQHHWNFGNMPRQPQVGASEITAIINYVRALQRANGIN